MTFGPELPFRLVDPAALDGELAREGAVSVPPGLDDKDALLAALSERVGFPGWFGGNWDALSDCLRDLSWHEGPLVLVHHDLPLRESSGLAIYLEILADAVSGQQDEPMKLSVVFPSDCAEDRSRAGSSPGELPRGDGPT